MIGLQSPTGTLPLLLSRCGAPVVAGSCPCAVRRRASAPLLPDVRAFHTPPSRCVLLLAFWLCAPCSRRSRWCAPERRCPFGWWPGACPSRRSRCGTQRGTEAARSTRMLQEPPRAPRPDPPTHAPAPASGSPFHLAHTKYSTHPPQPLCAPSELGAQPRAGCRAVSALCVAWSQWYFNGHAIPAESGGTSRELHMESFGVDDDGIYVCKARDRHCTLCLWMLSIPTSPLLAFHT